MNVFVRSLAFGLDGVIAYRGLMLVRRYAAGAAAVNGNCTVLRLSCTTLITSGSVRTVIRYHK